MEIKLSEKQLEQGVNREAQEWLDACKEAESIALITGFDGKEEVIVIRKPKEDNTGSVNR